MRKKRDLEVEIIIGPDTSRIVTEVLLELVDEYKDRLMAKIRENELEEKQA
ncbi:MAG: hypothetical protein RSA29_16950 [Clostridium sp.]|uniref:hypothetical protein n=1 Tax=Clostridium sp. TaxID=1506 RepID=UPI0030500449